MSFFRTSILLSTIACLTVIVHADDNESIRVAAKPNNNAKSKVPHPLDPAIEIAYQGLDRMKEIEDYTAQLIRRERTNGKLSPFEYSTVKIRNARPAEKIPFSIIWDSPSLAASMVAKQFGSRGRIATKLWHMKPE